MTQLQGWRITFDVMTDESARDGDIERSGFIDRYGQETNLNAPDTDMTFRQVVDVWNRERPCCYVEADEWPLRSPHWFTDRAQHGDSFGESRSVSIHVPDYVTTASRLRLARVLGVRTSC